MQDISNANHAISRESQPLQSRTCTECRRRKVRCNRRYPCSNCVKHESTCVFPRFRQPTRMPRRVSGTITRTSPAEQGGKQDHTLGQERESQLEDGSGYAPVVANGDNRSPSTSSKTFHESSRETFAERGGIPMHLNLIEGRSRYIGNHFWTSMSDEVEEMRDVLDESSSERETIAECRRPVSQYSFLFTTPDNTKSLQPLLPTTDRLLTMFDVFQENVDPVARIFYRPTLQKVVNGMLQTSFKVTRDVEAVVFTMCFAAVTSVDESECSRLFGEEQKPLLTQYRSCVEQSLARARFVESQNFNILAALVLFLLCVRRHDQSRFVSGMLGVAIRNAQAMGLHRDGTHFNLTPLETDLRRRLWWHICILDLRTSEDHGFDPSLFEHNYDTKLPLNVEDDDFSEDTSQPISSRQGWSSMIFSLLRFEMTIAIKRLHYRPPGLQDKMPPDPSENQRYVESVGKLFHDYINRCDIMQPIQWVSATWAQLMLTKLWLAVYNPLQTRDRIVPMCSRHVAFSKAIEVLELSDVLETSPRAVRWRWLFFTHTQWQAVVFVLAYICVAPNDPLLERAWLVVGKVYRRWSANLQAKAGMLWKPLDRLMAKAERVRSARAATENNVSGSETSGYSSNEAPQHTQPHATFPDILSSPSAPAAPAATYGTTMGSNTVPPPSNMDDSMPENYAPQNILLLDNHTQNFNPNESHFDPVLNTDSLAVESIGSDWDDLMHELQFDVQADDGLSLSNLPGALQGHASNIWDMF